MHPSCDPRHQRVVLNPVKGGVGDVLPELDAPDLASEHREQRGPVAVAGSHLEHRLVTVELECRDHLCHQRGLSGHLPMADRNRFVEIGAGGKFAGHKHGAWHPRDRGDRRRSRTPRRS